MPTALKLSVTDKNLLEALRARPGTWIPYTTLRDAQYDGRRMSSTNIASSLGKLTEAGLIERFDQVEIHVSIRGANAFVSNLCADDLKSVRRDVQKVYYRLPADPSALRDQVRALGEQADLNDQRLDDIAEARVKALSDALAAAQDFASTVASVVGLANVPGLPAPTAYNNFRDKVTRLDKEAHGLMARNRVLSDRVDEVEASIRNGLPTLEAEVMIDHRSDEAERLLTPSKYEPESSAKRIAFFNVPSITRHLTPEQRETLTGLGVEVAS